MDTDKNLLKTYEELTEWRKKVQPVKKLDEPSTLLIEINNIASSYSASLKDVNTNAGQICNETNDIKYQFESELGLYIGKESVCPLIQLKNIGTEVFADVSESDTDDSVFIEDIDFGPAYQKLEEMKKFANRCKKFINHLSSLVEGIAYLENESEKTLRSESTLSITGSDPSTSGFSLLENVATSSPLAISVQE